MNWTADQIAMLVFLVLLGALFGYMAGSSPRDRDD